MSLESNSALTAERHEIYRQLIVDQYLAGTERRENPKAIILAGQPGAGKSQLSANAIAELESEGGVVLVDTDDLRDFHPDYETLSEKNDREAASLVQQDAGQWADELAEAAMAKKRNLIIDGTLKSPDNASNLCQTLLQHGYDVEVRALAVAKEDSIQGVYNRYETAKSRNLSGRWVPERVHDAAYDGLVDSLKKLEQDNLEVRIEIYKRGETEPELIDTNSSPANALVRERNRERTPEELEVRDTIWNGKVDSPESKEPCIMQLIHRRDEKLSEPENRRAKVLADEARELAHGGKVRDSVPIQLRRSRSARRDSPDRGGRTR